MISPESANPNRQPTPDATGGPEAFEQLFRAYVNPLTRYVFSYVKSWEVAQDIVHDVFLQFWLRQQKDESVRDVGAYLYTLARNRALDWRRHQAVEARHRERYVASGAATADAAAPADAEQGMLSSEATALVQRAIDALPERQRAVLLLRCEREASYAEIAATLGIAAKTVDAHLQRAIGNLRKLLVRALG